MRTVEGPDGDRLVVRKASGDSLLVADPDTGEERYVERDAVDVLEGTSALETAASGVPEATRRVLRAVHDDEALGLLLELAARGPVPVRDLMSEYDLCESDLHGRLGEFRAAGLVAEADVGGERGYETTDVADEGLELLRGDADE